MIDYFIAVAIGYTLGAIPFGLLIGKLVKGVDVREYGSGKTGSTNVLRTVGVKAGIVVLTLDMAKGAITVLIARLLSDTPGTEVAAALATLVGHCWPVFIGFRGGRGIAPGLGALFIIAPFLGILAAAVGVTTIILSRYVSLGSMIGTSTALVSLTVLSLVGIHPIEYMSYGILGGVIILWRHTDNLVRITKGQERKIGRRSEQKQPTA